MSDIKNRKFSPIHDDTQKNKPDQTVQERQIVIDHLFIQYLFITEIAYNGLKHELTAVISRYSYVIEWYWLSKMAG